MVRQPYKIRTGLRQLRELRTGIRERRGAPIRYDDQDYICFYVEVEARARLLTRGVVSSLLRHPSLRVGAAYEKRSRLNRQDRHKLRQQHAEGKREALAWRNISFMGRPHPRWSKIQRSIESRMTELQSTPELLFLKTM